MDKLGKTTSIGIRMQHRFCLIVLISIVFAGTAGAQYRDVSFREWGSSTPVPGYAGRAGVGQAGAMDSVDLSIEAGTGEKLLYLTGSALSFALFDYVGFNLVRDDPVKTAIYRVVQALVHAGVTWFLYEQVGLPTAIGFNVLWWTWGLDAIYYGYTELFDVGGSWRGRGVFQSDIMNNNCTWASWTPVGMAQGMDPDKKLAGDALVAQSIIGAVLAVTITVSF